MSRTFTASGKVGGWVEANGDEFTRLYDAGGRVEEEIDALGNSTTYDYDVAGRLQTITDVTLGATTTFVRDSAGRVTDTTDALNHTTHTDYRLGGRVASTRNARGFTTSFDRTPMSSSLTDALSRTTVTSLSAYGLPLGTMYPGGSETASSYLGTTRLDGSQQFPTSLEDELQRSHDYGYDSKSALTSATDLAGQSWSYEYTPAARSQISYHPLSGSVNLTNADPTAAAYRRAWGESEYRDVSSIGDSDDAFSHMLHRVTSPMGEVTTIERGQNGRISSVTYPDGGSKAVTYGPDNQPREITLPQGESVSFTHDSTGREVSRATSVSGEFRTLAYGTGDRVTTMADNTGTTSYSYDPAGRLSGIAYPTGASISYLRDKLDRTTHVKVRASATATELITRYDYDENGNVSEITDPNGGVTGFLHDDADRVLQTVLPNGLTTSYEYDVRNRVVSVVHKNADNLVLASAVYERSTSGEPTKVTREDGTYVRIEYDAALRVGKERHFDANDVLVAEISYGHDADGNRRSRTTLTGSETYSYAAGFRLTSVAKSGGSDDEYAYDDAGRVVGIDRDGVHRTIEYDSMDHVTRVLDGGVQIERYSFDGMGRRVEVVTANGTRRFLVAPNRGDGYESVQAVADENGELLATYVYAGEHPIMKITPSSVEYLLGDHAGSVIAKADGIGNATATIRYDAFGNVMHADGPLAAPDPVIGSEPRFQGMPVDAATGFYFVRARSYDSRTGRFLSRDLALGSRAAPESFAPYAFGRNNPFVWADPTGRMYSLVDIMAATVIRFSLALIATASLAAILSKPIDDPNSQEAIDRARTTGGVGSGLCAARAFDWTVEDQRSVTIAWLEGLDRGAEMEDYVFSREYDAFGHCWVACNLCRKCGQDGAWFLGDSFEDARDIGFNPWVGFPWYGPHDSSRQDRNNHSIGISIAAEPGTCADGCGGGRLDLSAPRGEGGYAIRSRGL